MLTGRRPGGLLRLRRPERVDVADLRGVLDAALPGLGGPRVRVRLLQRTGTASLLVLQEDERSVRVPLDVLADDMSAAGVAPTDEGITAALHAWVAQRPVSDAAADAAGIAVLDWTDAARTDVRWRVAVPRRGLAVTWQPSPEAPPAAVARTRARALGRSTGLALHLRVEGSVALWSHPVVPLLAGAVLAAPPAMLARMAAAGLPMTDPHVVVTPDRPVACAEPPVAARLAGEIPQACVTLPWDRLPGLPWA